MRRIANPVIIDVEASGFGSTSYPIEVGVAFADDYRFCSLITPVPGWTHWDENAEKIHGISRETLHSCGISVQDACTELNKRLNGITLYSDGWVVDHSWLIELFHVANRRMLFHVSPIEMILSEAQMALWHDIKDDIIKQTNLVRHRASNDAWIIQETYRQTLRLTESKYRYA